MKKIVAALFALSLCLAAQGAWHQGRTQVNVIYPAISGVNNALWIAAEANTFGKYGLDVALLYVPSAPQVVRVMLAGDSKISLTGGAPVVSADLSGADLVFIGGVGQVPGFFFLGQRGIKKNGGREGEGGGW